jgi:recombinational DNA repair protein (RecF pathway)
MSEHESTFIKQFQADITAFKLDIDERYKRMQGFLISIIVVLIGAGITVNFTHFTKDGETRASVATLQERQNIVIANAVSQKAIDDLIYIFEERTKVMQEFLPNDIKGYIKASNEMDNNFRSYILRYQSGINVRSIGDGTTVPDGGGME